MDIKVAQTPFALLQTWNLAYLFRNIVLCTCALSVGVYSWAHCLSPPSLCLCSCIPLRFRLWQFNSLGPAIPSYWKAVYDLHVISSKCCHHLSLFTQLSDPVTFTDNTVQVSTVTQIPRLRLWHVNTSSRILYDLFLVISYSWVLPMWPLSFSYEQKIQEWTANDPVQLQRRGHYYLNPHYYFTVNRWHAVYALYTQDSTVEQELYFEVLNANSHFSVFILIHHRTPKSIH